LKTLGIIPARAGSKSIPHKNTVEFGGKPLIEWVIDAGKASNLDMLLCSTDDPMVMDICDAKGVQWLQRHPDLAGDDAPIFDVVMDVLNSTYSGWPFKDEIEVVALLQPTSPFITPYHINHCINMLDFDASLASIQTITQVPHNFHAHNQRQFDEKGHVSFIFPEERAVEYNKQRKHKHFMFGNLVVTRVDSLRYGLFAAPSFGYEIEPEYALDIESHRDIELGEWYLERGKIDGICKTDRFRYWYKEGSVDWSGPAMSDCCGSGSCSLREDRPSD